MQTIILFGWKIKNKNLHCAGQEVQRLSCQQPFALRNALDENEREVKNKSLCEGQDTTDVYILSSPLLYSCRQ